MPCYDEIAHIPLFIHDPRFAADGQRRKEIVQTIDLPATVLEFFNVGLPKNMQGRPIRTVIEKDEKSGIMHYLEFTVRMLIFMMENIFI